MPDEAPQNELTAEQENPGPAQQAPGADMGFESGDELDLSGIETLMGLDPFAEPPAETSDGGTGEEPPPKAEETPPTGSEPGTETPAGEEEQTPAGEQPATQEDPEKALLRQQVEQLTQTVTQLSQQMQQSAGQQPGQQPGQSGQQPSGEAPQIEIPDYAFNIPDELVGLLDSDNPAERKQGFAAMAQGLARTVHQVVMGAVQQTYIDPLPQQFQGMIEQQLQAKEIFSDFYGKYSALNKPELRPLVIQTMQQVVQETGAKQWSDSLRDTIGARVMGLIGQGVTTPPPKTPAKTPAQPTPAGPGTRPAAPVVDQSANSSDDISQVVFGH